MAEDNVVRSCSYHGNPCPKAAVNPDRADTTPASGTQTRPGSLMSTSDGQMVWGGPVVYRGITLAAGSFINSDGTTIELDRPTQIGDAWYSCTVRVSEEGEVISGILASETRTKNGDVLPAGTEVWYSGSDLAKVRSSTHALTIRGISVPANTDIELDNEGYARRLEFHSVRGTTYDNRSYPNYYSIIIDHQGHRIEQ
ncbi:MAG: hypothetical protein WC645_00495 [Candidatus Margulisiibacteriota bacterium]